MGNGTIKSTPLDWDSPIGGKHLKEEPGQATHAKKITDFKKKRADVSKLIGIIWQGCQDRLSELRVELALTGGISPENIDQAIAMVTDPEVGSFPLRKTPPSVIRDAGEVRQLGSLELPEPNSPEELLKHRFLCRGGSLLFVGPTGVGKSSCIMQGAILWSIGKPFFGIEPVRPIKTLIIQAENDEGDLAEMRDGIFMGLGDAITAEECATARKSITICMVDTVTGDAFGPLLNTLVSEHKPDVVVMDPALAYIGGDALKQMDVTRFLRTTISPVVHKHNIGLIIVHHTNKPPRGEEKSDWKAGDFAYLGQGAAEWANMARGVMGIRSIGSHEVFELVLGKRGGRVGWKDGKGVKIYSKKIAHSKEHGVICWRELSDEEYFDEMSVEIKPGMGGKTCQDLFDLVPEIEPITKATLFKTCAAIGISERKSKLFLDGFTAEDAKPRLYIWKRKRQGTNPLQLVARSEQPEDELALFETCAPLQKSLRKSTKNRSSKTERETDSCTHPPTE